MDLNQQPFNLSFIYSTFIIIEILVHVISSPVQFAEVAKRRFHNRPDLFYYNLLSF